MRENGIFLVLHGNIGNSERAKANENCNLRRPPQEDAASCCCGGTDEPGRREDSVSVLTDPNQSAHNKEQQDFVPTTSMREQLKRNHPTRSQKGVLRGVTPLSGVEGQRPSPSETFVP